MIAQRRPRPAPVPGPADFASAILTAPAAALLAIVGGVLLAIVAGEDTIDASILAGLGAYALVPPAGVLLRARSHGFGLESASVAPSPPYRVLRAIGAGRHAASVAARAVVRRPLEPWQQTRNAPAAMP